MKNIWNINYVFIFTLNNMNTQVSIIIQTIHDNSGNNACTCSTQEVAMRWATRIQFLAGTVTFSFTTVSRPALGPSQPPTQWEPEVLSPGVKQPGHEDDYSPPSSAKVKNAQIYTSTPLYIFMLWCFIKNRGYIFMRWYLDKHIDNFTFTLPIFCKL
jgi:hypothetical protein